MAYTIIAPKPECTYMNLQGIFDSGATLIRTQKPLSA